MALDADRAGRGGFFLDLPPLQNSFTQDVGLQAYLAARYPPLGKRQKAGGIKSYGSMDEGISRRMPPREMNRYPPQRWVPEKVVA